jgi:Ran GTPase-activating protein (RanGAP) involved in mRNA processing and transport
VAPGLRSLNICDRKDAERILGTLFESHVDLRKLILKYCDLGVDGTDILTKIVTLYPDLEALSLEDCRPSTSAGYSLIPRLKKLSELNLSHCQVHCVSV